MKRCVQVLRAASVWVSLLSSSGHVLADDGPAPPEQARTGPGEDAREAVAPNASTEQLAAMAYQKALASYAKGDVPAALDSMRESYQLSKRAELLYNLAQIEEELKDCPEALADYRRYLELVPNGHYRDSAVQGQGRLERTCPPRAPEPTPVAPSPAPSPPPNPDPKAESEMHPAGYWNAARVLGWSAIATGTLAGAGALYCQAEAIRARDELQQGVDNAAEGGPDPDWSLQDRQHRYNHAAIGLGITAGALVTAGVLVLLLDPANTDTRTRNADLYVSPGLLGASYTQRF